jgi:hypothetical protein
MTQNYPAKLVVVGMRFLPGALEYLKDVKRSTSFGDVDVYFQVEKNQKGVDGKAIKVFLQDRYDNDTDLQEVGYIRNDDLPEALESFPYIISDGPAKVGYKLASIAVHYIILLLDEDSENKLDANTIDAKCLDVKSLTASTIYPSDTTQQSNIMNTNSIRDQFFREERSYRHPNW